jgi:hypothetical protein
MAVEDYLIPALNIARQQAANSSHAIKGFVQSENEFIAEARAMRNTIDELRSLNDLNCKHGNGHLAQAKRNFNRQVAAKTTIRATIAACTRSETIPINEREHGDYVRASEAHTLSIKDRRYINAATICIAEWHTCYLAVKEQLAEYLVQDCYKIMNGQGQDSELMQSQTGQYPFYVMKASKDLFHIEKHLEMFGEEAPEGSLKHKFIMKKFAYWNHSDRFQSDQQTMPEFLPEVTLSPYLLTAFEEKYVGDGKDLAGQPFGFDQLNHPLHPKNLISDSIGLNVEFDYY